MVCSVWGNSYDESIEWPRLSERNATSDSLATRATIRFSRPKPNFGGFRYLR